jgi:hypothetical protein
MQIRDVLQLGDALTELIDLCLPFVIYFREPLADRIDKRGGDSAAFAVHGHVDAGGEVTDEFVLADCVVVQRRRCSGICAASSQRLIWRSINGSLWLKARALRANWCPGSLSSVTP